MAFDVKQAIVDRLLATKRENIDTVIDFMETNGFFTCNCNRHHHYYGGLAEHSWQTYLIAQKQNSQNHLQCQGSSRRIDDSIAIAAFLHDLCNCSGMSHIRGYGRRSARILKELGFKLTVEEFLAIRFHMSIHNKTTHHLYEQAQFCKLCYVVHIADGKSARLGKGWSVPDGYGA